MSICYKLQSFDFIHGVTLVPSEAIWYRGCRSDEVLGNDPLFFGDMEVAWLNAHQPGRVLREYKCVKALRLIDMRYIMAILPYIIKNTDNINTIERLYRGLGICTFRKQIELLEKLNNSDYPDLVNAIRRMRLFEKLKKKPSWVSPVEMRGVRAGIANEDYLLISWLKDLFEKTVDGIVSPALPTPFHDQGMPDVGRSVMMQELIIFNPKRCLEFIQERPVKSIIEYHYQTLPFDMILKSNYREFVSGHLIMSGGTTLQPKTPRKIVYLPNKDEIDGKTKALLVDERRAWMPHIRRIQKSQEYLKHTYSTMLVLQPAKKNPSGHPKMERIE